MHLVLESNVKEKTHILTVSFNKQLQGTYMHGLIGHLLFEVGVITTKPAEITVKRQFVKKKWNELSKTQERFAGGHLEINVNEMKLFVSYILTSGIKHCLSTDDS